MPLIAIKSEFLATSIMPKKRQSYPMQVWLPAADRIRLAAAAEKTGCTKSELAREAIHLLLNDMEDRARARAAITETGMSFDQFTRSAKIVIARAEVEAYKLGFNTIGSEHLLLALCRDELVRDVLASSGITYGAAQHKVQVLQGFGNDSVLAELTLSRDCDQCLKRSRRMAKHFHDDFIDSVHLVLSLLEQFNAGAYDVIEILGVDRASLRASVLKLKPELPPKKVRRRRS